MLAYRFYQDALPYDAFFTQFGTDAQKARWDRTRQAVVLTPEQRSLLAGFTRETNVLMLAGAWCGDCAGNCPIFEAFAAAAPVLKVRYLDRDAFPEAQAELKINGGNRVPVAVFFSEDGLEVSRYGERTLTSYRRMAAEVSGEACGTGVVSADHLAAIAADWLREVERAQWVLRLSPRLRKLHAD